MFPFGVLVCAKGLNFFLLKFILSHMKKPLCSPICSTNQQFTGDLWSFNRETKQYIVSPEPDVDAFKLRKSVKFLVLGSDGLTNVLKPRQISDLVMGCERATEKVGDFRIVILFWDCF